MDIFDAYRRTFASADDDELVVWWYCGVVNSARDGVGQVPLTQAETIMVYRTRTLDADTYAIDWTEVGYFRDLATGERMEGWFNPFHQRTEPYPASFVDGPATFTVRRRGDQADVSLVQHNARIDSVVLDVTVNPRSLGLVQSETKTRTFHRPDGSLPALDSADATAIVTRLSVWADLGALADPERRNVPSHGHYTSGASAQGGGTGSWASTQVQGVMRKAAVDERVNPAAWDRLASLYPRFFKGGLIDPDWT